MRRRATAAPARTPGAWRSTSASKRRSSLRSSFHWQRLIFSPARWLESGDRCLPRRQQPSAIHENNGTQFLLVGVKSLLQVLQPQATLESTNHCSVHPQKKKYPDLFD
ncbi:uncharacterized protein [Triticum aestivum]|uniref:uncharacterized protein n=1 Tax=Triticum aestivum TaxID=4565 RepID=UPI001D0023F0|nr:uncharacterized protein LOC123050404 [Triticum aestivum]